MLTVALGGDTGLVTLIDDEDADLVLDVRWSLNNHYARGRLSDGRLEYLHRLLMGLTPGDPRQVDHVNRDKLDNRRENLRIVTVAEQRHNQGSRPNTSSRYRGVSLYRRTGRWAAQVKLHGRRHHLGYFSTEEAAAEVAAAFRRERMTHATG